MNGYVSLLYTRQAPHRTQELLEALFKKTLPATQKETLHSNNHTLATNAPNALREGIVSPRQHVAAERGKTDSFNVKNVSLLGGDRQLENSQKASSVALNINSGSFAHHAASGLGRLIDPRDGSFHQSGVQKPTLSTQPTVSASPQPVSTGQNRLNNWLDGYPPSSVPHLPGELRPDNAVCLQATHHSRTARGPQDLSLSLLQSNTILIKKHLAYISAQAHNSTLHHSTQDKRGDAGNG